MRYTGVLLLLTALCFVSCTGKKDFKDGIVQLQSRPVSLSLDKMRCMWNGKDTVDMTRTLSWWSTPIRQHVLLVG